MVKRAQSIRTVPKRKEFIQCMITLSEKRDSHQRLSPTEVDEFSSVFRHPDRDLNRREVSDLWQNRLAYFDQ